jgi:hypothetical protein
VIDTEEEEIKYMDPLQPGPAVPDGGIMYINMLKVIHLKHTENTVYLYVPISAIILKAHLADVHKSKTI